MSLSCGLEKHTVTHLYHGLSSKEKRDCTWGDSQRHHAEGKISIPGVPYRVILFMCRLEKESVGWDHRGCTGEPLGRWDCYMLVGGSGRSIHVLRLIELHTEVFYFYCM